MNRKITVISPDMRFAEYVRQVTGHRRLLAFLVGREVLSRYRQTTFGLLWAALQPLSMMAILTFAYKHYISTQNNGMPYALFVLSGLLPWQLFSRTIESSAIAMLQHKSLITKIYIPRIYLPLSNSIVGLIDTAFGLLILMMVMAYYHVYPQWRFLLMPLWICYSFYCALGIGFIMAVLNVQYRDVQYVIPFLVRMGFFLTPVSYPASGIPEAWLPVFFLNPLAGAIELVHWSVSGTPVYGTGIAISVAVSTALLVCALRMFQRTEYKIADVI